VRLARPGGRGGGGRLRRERWRVLARHRRGKLSLRVYSLGGKNVILGRILAILLRTSIVHIYLSY
jgi:hypothetical protein